MIKINQIKLPWNCSKDDLLLKICKIVRCHQDDIKEMQILKKSIDARKKEQIFAVFSVQLELPAALEKKMIKLNKDCVSWESKPYEFFSTGELPLCQRPIIIGSGPCGLFAAYFLAKAGYAPLIIERGKEVEKRMADVDEFWQTGKLNLESNVQFGEGGAGTFSDGKLNTLVKDTQGRNGEVLRIFREAGAPEEILYEAKPHIGTDLLVNVMKNMRKQIQDFGGEYLFESKVTQLQIESQSGDSFNCGDPFNSPTITGVFVNETQFIPTSIVVLAIGHSARDSFELLEQQKVEMSAKSFAVGLRVEHPQQRIQENQYGQIGDQLPPVNYKLVAQTRKKRGVYSFCMCPGGYVVNSSSEANRLVVNGMSEFKRDSKNANSAIIVSVEPDDFPGEGPLKGVAFQRQLEEKAFFLGNGKIPQQLYGDFIKQQPSTGPGSFESCTKGETIWTDLSGLFSTEINTAFIEGMNIFEQKIKGFASDDMILSGVESRTSSPVRIHRNEDLESNIHGLYPAGEGAGYAGGIMSAAMDGIRVAEKIAEKYKRMG